MENGDSDHLFSLSSLSWSSPLLVIGTVVEILLALPSFHPIPSSFLIEVYQVNLLMLVFEFPKHLDLI